MDNKFEASWVICFGVGKYWLRPGAYAGLNDCHSWHYKREAQRIALAMIEPCTVVRRRERRAIEEAHCEK